MLNRKYLFIGFILLESFFQLLNAQTYQVGSLITNPDGSQGVVFFVNPDGTGGWMVALNDFPTNSFWSTDLTDISTLANINITIYPGSHAQYYAALYDTAGYSNTQKIRIFQNNNTNTAAGRVDFTNGWYLPAMGQLFELYGAQPIINATIIASGGTILSSSSYHPYWSSTEYDDTRSWYLYSDLGFSNFNYKNSTYSVRAVRSFSNQTIVYDTTLTYLWNTGSTQPDITKSPTTTTTYTVTVTSGSGCTNSATQTIFVNSAMTQTIYDTVCVGYPYHENGFNISASAITTPGIYYFTDTLTTQYGCDSIIFLILNIFGTPNITILATPDVICSGDTTHLVAIDTGTTSTTIYYPPVVAIGDILCTDSTIVKPSDWPVPGKTAKGVVFYVDTSGIHGWAVHLNDQSTGIQWSTLEIDIPTLPNYTGQQNAEMDLNGYSNTQIIRAAGNASIYPAAWTMDFADGWYLPSVGQLRMLHGVIRWINSTLQIVNGTQFPTHLNNSNETYWSYWSSNEYSSYIAWPLNGFGVFGFNSGKNQFHRVRAVRAF